MIATLSAMFVDGVMMPLPHRRAASASVVVGAQVIAKHVGRGDIAASDVVWGADTVGNHSVVVDPRLTRSSSSWSSASGIAPVDPAAASAASFEG
jgi:hypothetical protein